jgi:hypothetical protein
VRKACDVASRIALLGKPNTVREFSGWRGDGGFLESEVLLDGGYESDAWANLGFVADDFGACGGAR